MTPSSVASARARFVVTGIGRVTPFGNSWPEYTQGDLGGVDKHSYCRVPPFRIRDHLDRLRLPLPMRFSQLAMLAASHALNQASLTATNTRTVATIISTDFGPMGAVTTFLRSLHSSDGSYPSPLLFSRATANVALGDVARYWSLQGPHLWSSGTRLSATPWKSWREGTRLSSCAGALTSLRKSQFRSSASSGTLVAHQGPGRRPRRPLSNLPSSWCLRRLNLRAGEAWCRCYASVPAPPHWCAPAGPRRLWRRRRRARWQMLGGRGRRLPICCGQAPKSQPKPKNLKSPTSSASKRPTLLSVLLLAISCRPPRVRA